MHSQVFSARSRLGGGLMLVTVALTSGQALSSQLLVKPSRVGGRSGEPGAAGHGRFGISCLRGREGEAQRRVGWPVLVWRVGRPCSRPTREPAAPGQWRRQADAPVPGDDGDWRSARRAVELDKSSVLPVTPLRLIWSTSKPWGSFASDGRQRPCTRCRNWTARRRMAWSGPSLQRVQPEKQATTVREPGEKDFGFTEGEQSI